ncbi:MAG: hypothetical protein KAQ69_01425 [Spirochaetales bacterium]|nr:hypothetical protein [Spirochaetales bacterium]
MVKKNITLIILAMLLSALLLSACTTPAIPLKPDIFVEKGELQTPRIVTITGKVEILPDGSPTLIEKWESKSRVTYDVIGDMGEKIRLMDGNILTVECIVLSMESPWSGKLVIVTVQQ